MLPSILTTILFSLSALFANRAIRSLGGIPTHFIRLCLATLFLAIWAYSFGQGVRGDAFLCFFVSGCAGFGFGDIALFFTMSRLGPRPAVLMTQCLAVPIAALTEWLWLGTTLSSSQIFYSVVILIGVSFSLTSNLSIPKHYMPGICYGVFAACGQALGAVISRKAYVITSLAGQSIDGMSAAYQRLLGGLLVSIFGFILIKTQQRLRGTGPTPPLNIHTPWRKALPWVILTALVGPSLGVSCYQWALETTPSGLVLSIVATTPIVIIPFAYLMDGDKPTRRSLIGSIISVLGVIALKYVS